MILVLLCNLECCQAKKKRNQKEKQPIELRDDEMNRRYEYFGDTSDYIDKIKFKTHPCLYDFRKLDKFAASDRLSVIIRTRKKVLDEMIACRPALDKYIDDRLDQLGIVGETIREWMRMLEKLPWTNLQKRDELHEGVDVRGDKFFTDLMEGTLDGMYDRYKKTLGLNPTTESSSRARKGKARVEETVGSDNEDALGRIEDGESVQNVLKWRAFLYGRGLCLHLKEDPIRMIYGRINLTSNLDIGKCNMNKGLEYLDLFTNLSLINKNAKELSTTGKFFELRILCKRLNVFDTPQRLIAIGKPYKTFDQLECRKNIDETIKMFLNGGSKDIFFPDTGEDPNLDIDLDLSASSNIDESETSDSRTDDYCNYISFLRLRTAHRCTYYLDKFKVDVNEIKIILQSISSSLLRTCFNYYDDEIEPILSPIMRTPQYELATKYIDALTKYLNRKDQIEQTRFHMLEWVLGSRTVDNNYLEVDFFLKTKVEGLDLIRAYKTGDEMCDIFDTDEWKKVYSSDNKVLLMFELLTDLYQTREYRPRLRNDLIDLYNLWEICSKIKLLPLYD